MYREYIWTINPNTTFSLQAANKSEVYLLETVNWNNISNYQYFTIYNSSILPIADFWTTAQGLKLFNFAVKLGYDKKSLKTMIAAEITKLRNVFSNWKISEKEGMILGYSIGVMLILAASIISYDYYLKQKKLIINLKLFY